MYEKQIESRTTVESDSGVQVRKRNGWQNVFCNSPSPKSVNNYSQKDETTVRGSF